MLGWGWLCVLELQDAFDRFEDFVTLISVEILCVPP